MEIRKLAGAAALAAVLLAAPAGADPESSPLDPVRPEAPPGVPAALPTDALGVPGALPADALGGPAALPTDEVAAPAAPAPSPGSVARATFTLDVIDREPGAAVHELANDHDRVLFFTDLRDFQGQELVHRWEHGGQVMAEVPFGIDGPRWRVYSSKALDPSWLGTWTVSVVDAAGQVVEQQSFDYVAAPEPVAEAPEVAGATAHQPGPAAPAESPAYQPGPAAPAEYPAHQPGPAAPAE